MDAKLNHSELSALFAKEANISGAKAEAFTKAVFDIIIEGLEKDGVVKINGLGTFKVADVASRNSVNVNTGEKFEIKGHRKLTFTPADSLKDEVNQPFAMFEPVEVDETYLEETEEEMTAENTIIEEGVDEEPVHSTQAFEPIEEEMPAEENIYEQKKQPLEYDIIEEEMPSDETETTEEAIPQAATASTTVVAVEKAEELYENIDEPADDTVIEEPQVAEQPQSEQTQPELCEAEDEEPVEEQSVEEETVQVAPVAEAAETVAEEHIAKSDVAEEKNIVAATVETTDTPATGKSKKKKRRALWTMLIFLVAILLIGINRFGNTDAKPAATSISTTEETKTEEVAKPQQTVTEEPSAAPVKEVEQPYSFVVTEELAALDLKNITVADTTLYSFAGVYAVHTVAEDETLTKIALKYFGDKKLWPYIVRDNRLSKPNDLCKGMEIIIPRLKPIK